MRKKGANLCQQNCDPLDEDNDFTLSVESQRSHFPDFAAPRDRSCLSGGPNPVWSRIIPRSDQFSTVPEPKSSHTLHRLRRT